MKKVLLVDQDIMFTSDVITTLFIDDYKLEVVQQNDINNLAEKISAEKPDEVVIHARLLEDYPNWKDLDISVSAYAKTKKDLEIAEDQKVPCYGLITLPEALLKLVEKGEPKQITRGNHEEKKKEEVPAKDTKNDDILDAIEAEPNQKNKRQENKPEAAKTTKEVVREQKAKEEPSIIENSETQNSTSLLKERVARAKEEKARKEAEEAAKNSAEEAVDKDLGLVKKPARLITAYSAKGGVGKTKIASELAAYLALTSHGRGTFNVCVIDYNIDSGNIMNTLGFDAQGICMTQWANDIQEHLNRGENPKDIRYTEKQIAMYLQRHPDISLSALLSPMTPGDSLEVTDEQMTVMYDNIVNNGGFDFVIVDTGNNIRDSTYMALERAETVLLIVTQDFNCMNDNYGVMTMAENLGDFDMNKVKLVLNQARKGKVGISVDEVLHSMINPASKEEEPFECIAVIEDNDSVRRATNLHEPLVLTDSNNRFTRSIGEIVSYLTDDDFVLEAPKKKGFFARLFGK